VPDYHVHFSEEGRSDCSQLVAGPRRDVKAYWRLLAYALDLPESKPLELADRDDIWRIRVGRSVWRIVCEYNLSGRVITITDIKRRLSVYDRYSQPQASWR